LNFFPRFPAPFPIGPIRMVRQLQKMTVPDSTDSVSNFYCVSPNRIGNSVCPLQYRLPLLKVPRYFFRSLKRLWSTWEYRATFPLPGLQVFSPSFLKTPPWVPKTPSPTFLSGPRTSFAKFVLSGRLFRKEPQERSPVFMLWSYLSLIPSDPGLGNNLLMVSPSWLRSSLSKK